MSSTTFGPGRFNLAQAPESPATTETRAMATAAENDPDGRLLHPDNPLVAFGVLAAVVFGLMAFSTSVRVGPTTASVQIGETS